MLERVVRIKSARNPVPQNRFQLASVMTELFAPLERLLGSGGDSRLCVDPVSGLNEYGCQPLPCPDTLSFASSTATSISARAYDRAGYARESLMRSAIVVGIDAAFDARVEAMRAELKACLGLSQADVEVVFSPSGTDAQLQALFLARALKGRALTTLIVAADQTGSGTAYTARGQHFNAITANGGQVRMGQPIAGLADSVASVALGLFDEAGGFRPQAEIDAQVLDAIERSVASGTNVLLQIMDSSKLGWRAPSNRCLDEIAMRWPDQVQVVVDACQMRLGRLRLRKYLERGCMVIITGSKFFTGPAFSGALLVPSGLSKALDTVGEIASGLSGYCSRSDWPRGWRSLRSRFPARTNFGQWLRWEAALEEISAYYKVPDAFRLAALTTFGRGVEQIIASSPSLRPLSARQGCEGVGADDEELAETTIFPFVIVHGDRVLSLDDCRKIHRALARDARDAVAAGPHCDAEVAARLCLVGQPVALTGAFSSQRVARNARPMTGSVETGSREENASNQESRAPFRFNRNGKGSSGGQHPVAALRICAGARFVTEAWASGADMADGNLQRELGRVGAVVAKIEWLLAHMDGLRGSP